MDRGGAADGFILGFPVIAEGLEDFTALVLPILKDRGYFDGELSGQPFGKISACPSRQAVMRSPLPRKKPALEREAATSREVLPNEHPYRRRHRDDAAEREIRTFLPEIIALRHDLHRHPELAFRERRTAGVIARFLLSYGYTVHEGIGGTGVVATLKRGRSGRRLGLRADFDALPITEQTGVPSLPKIRCDACLRS